MRRINYALRKNRRILEKLKQYGLGKVEKNTLVREGFDFEYVTSVVRNGKGPILYFCYDHGYHDLGDDVVELVMRQDKLWLV
jgi:hypothetical protein